MEELNDDLDRKYKEIAKYMDRDKLVLNSNKTCLMVMWNNNNSPRVTWMVVVW